MKSFILSTLLLFAQFYFSQNARPIPQKIITAQSQNQSFTKYSIFSENKDSQRLAIIQESAKDATLLSLNKIGLSSLLKETPKFVEISFPFRGKELVVLMQHTNILTDTFHVDTSDGNPVDYKPGVYYQGIVKGDSSSVVAFSFFDDNVIGIASQLGVGNIVVGKAKNANHFVSYSDATLTKSNPFICEVDELMENQKQKISFNPNMTSKKVMSENCVRIYYEICNAPYVNNNSDITQTTNWITAIHNNIQTLYTNDEVNVSLNAVYIWTTADPYTGSFSQNLVAFRNNRTTFDGDLAHLVNHPSTTSVAYLNSLCTSNRYAYSGISMTYNNVPTYSWTVQAMTHEMGHSLGSPHTHACAWNGNNTAIDGCGPTAGYSEGCNAALPTNGGTIMSYCHAVGGVGINLANGFGVQPAQLIKNTVDSKACLGTNCIAACSLTVTGFNINTITNNSVNGVVTDNTSTSWKYRIRTFDNNVVQTGTSNVANIPVTGLSPNTYYIMDVGTDCSSSQAYQKSRFFLTEDSWCDGKTFTDMGGATGNYPDNINFVKTFYPSTSGGVISLDFTSFDLETGYDFLTIYNGSSTSSPVFANGNQLTGVLSPMSFTSTHFSGAITIQFTSDVYVNNPGWVATVSCKNILAINEANANNTLDIFPNPVKNELTIVSPNKIKSYIIFDASGRKVLSQEHLKTEKLDIDVSELIKGNYIISLETDSGIVNRKLVKE